MKFSKLIKNGTKKQEMKLKRNAVLLSGIYSTQSPTVVNNYFTPSKPATAAAFLDDIEKTIVPQTPQTYEQRYNINTIASTKKTPTFKISPLAKLFEFKSGNKNAVENAIAKQRLIQCLLETPGGCKVGTITPRFAKSEKSKAKRLQRRDLAGNNNSARKYELRSSCSTGLDQVDSNHTPKMSLFSAKKQSVKCLLDFNSASPAPGPITTGSNSAGKESMVSRLKKLVSKSALKVTSQRKSFGSNCSSSSLSSNNDSSLFSSDDSFCDRSMQQKKINLNLEKLIDADCQRNQTAKVTAWSYQKPTPVTAEVAPVKPSMGLTSLMLKNQRRVNPKASVSSCMPTAGLLSVVPHVFDKRKILGGEESSAYDHLERVNYNQVKQQGRKAVTGGNVQKMVNKFQKNKSVAAIVQPQASPKVTRISVYAKKHLSAVNLNESQQYDSIIF